MGHFEYPVAFQSSEFLFCGAMKLFDPLQKRFEFWGVADRVEPWVALHGWEREETSINYTLKDFQRQIDLVEAGEMAREVEEAFRIAEV